MSIKSDAQLTKTDLKSFHVICLMCVHMCLPYLSLFISEVHFGKNKSTVRNQQRFPRVQIINLYPIICKLQKENA